MSHVIERLRARVTDTMTRFDAMSLRERLLIGGAALAVVWMAWDWTLGRGLADKVADLDRQIASIAQRTRAEVQVQAQLEKRSKENPNTSLIAEKSALSSEVDALNARLEALLGGFVDPERMPVVLEDVVQRFDGVSLTRVTSLPVEPVRVSEDDDAPSLFRHTLRVELEGTYFEVLAYLAELESAPWRFAWRTLDYSVSEYPRATVLVEIETLSRDRNWLGV